MKNILVASAITLLSAQAFAALSVNDGLSSCRFSSKEAASNYARALNGSTSAAASLSKADLSQVEACSTAMTEALAKGVSYAELANNLNTKFNHLQNGMEVTIELRGTDYYLADGSEFTGTKSTMEGDFDMVISVDGSRNEISQGIPTATEVNNMRLQVLSKNKVRITDAQSGIDAEVDAVVKKTILGKVKHISVSSQELERALAPLLEKEGLSLAKGFKMSTEEGSFTMDYEVSAMECELNESKALACDSSFTFQLTTQF